jgi:ribonuclease R
MGEFPSNHEILAIFEARPEKEFRLRELVETLGLRSSQARQLRSALKALFKQRKILCLKKSHFALARRGHFSSALRGESQTRAPSVQQDRQTHIVTGRLIGHRDGYGFVAPDRPVDEEGQDIFIPRDAIKDAMHGDRVEVQVFRSRLPRRGERAKLEGTILRVIDRAQKTVVGEFHYGSRYNYVVPFDQHISREIVVAQGEEWPEQQRRERGRNRQFSGDGGEVLTGRGFVTPPSLEGMIVDVEITRFPGRASPPRGRVTEILGRRDDFGVDVEIMIRKFHLPHRFPLEALAEAESAPQLVLDAEREGREDFRPLPVVTIDGETAKDFDDAVYVERSAGGGYKLHVHIADVAHYVRPGTALDREARLRGTSVYFPDRAVPMLPLELSNGICSLNPRAERLAMSVLMEIDTQGHTVACRLTPGIIRSAERMTYTAVHAILAGEETACQRYHGLASQFRLMEELARVLYKRREARGSIDFDLPEPEIAFDEQGRMTGITRSERNIAHRIIEEFMLAANEAVAAWLEKRNIPSLYRIHEKPDPKKVVEFEEIAATFGYSLGVELPAIRRVRLRGRNERERYPRYQELAIPENFEITSRHYQRLTQKIAGKPEERILSYLMLRSLKQARYSDENAGHFALASPTYTHFTSPIRRYPDLIVHRILKAALGPDARPEVQKPGSQAAAVIPPGGSRQPAIAPYAGRGPAGERLTAPGGLAGGVFLHKPELKALGVETSESERRAAEAERELMDWKKVTFMSGRVGDEFEALIISLTRYGFFVELLELFVEGFVPVESFGDPDWVYRQKVQALTHRDKKRIYSLGDRVTVRLDRIDRAGNKLVFSVME